MRRSPRQARVFRASLIVFASLFASAALHAGIAVAEGPTPAQYPELRERYLKLRNTDIRLSKADDWRDVAGKLSEFARNFPREEGASSALFNASVMYEKLYRKYNDRGDIERSCELLERLIREYPKAPLTDQAIMRLGELVMTDFGSKNGARYAFGELLERFPRSNLAVSARLRKDAIDAEAEGKAVSGLQPSELSEVLAQVDSTPSAERKGPKVVLDPGHGGEDFGAMGVGGQLEKDVAFEIAQRLKAILEARLDAQVWLTRTSDSFVPLAERTEFANSKQADVFISLHMNASPQHLQEGFETYYLDNSEDQASQKLAERENGAAEPGTQEGDLAFILSDLIQSGKIEDSQRLASAIQASLLATVGKVSRNRGVRRAPFYVLVGAHMPCVLVELAFVDHPKEGARVASGEVRRQLAEGVYSGIRGFLGVPEVSKRRDAPPTRTTKSVPVKVESPKGAKGSVKPTSKNTAPKKKAAPPPKKPVPAKKVPTKVAAKSAPKPQVKSKSPPVKQQSAAKSASSKNAKKGTR